MKISPLSTLALILAALAMILHVYMRGSAHSKATPITHRLTGTDHHALMAARCELNGGKGTVALRVEGFASPAGPYEEWTCWRKNQFTRAQVLVRPILYVRKRTDDETETGFLVWED